MTSVPLINDYKKPFIRQRLLQTFTGGLNLTGCSVKAKICQIVAFLMPTVFTIVALSVDAGTNYSLPEYVAPAILGGLILLYGLLTQAISICTSQKFSKNALVPAAQTTEPAISSANGDTRIQEFDSSGVYEDEDEIPASAGGAREEEAASKVAESTGFAFYFPVKRPWFMAVIQPLFGAVTAAAAMRVVQRAGVVFGAAEATIAVAVFATLSVSIAIYSTICSPPPETAVYRALEVGALSGVSRSFHVLLLCLPSLCLDAWGPPPHQPWDAAAAVSVCLLPLAWLLGYLPPAEPLLIFCSEQALVHLFGGSPISQSASKLCLYLILSIASYLIVLFACGTNVLAVLIAASLLGYVLSLNLAVVLSWLFSKCKCCSASKKANAEKDPVKVPKKVKPRTSSNIKTGVLIVVFFSATGLVIGLLPAIVAEESVKVPMLAWVTWTLFAALQLSRQARRAYWLFAAVRNPLYGRFKGFCCLRSVHYFLDGFLIPLMLVYDVKCMIASDSAFFSEEGLFPAWIDVLAIIRVTRTVWQRGGEAAIPEFAIYHIIECGSTVCSSRQIREDGTASLCWEGAIEFLSRTSRPMQLLLIAFLLDRLHQAFTKLYYAVLLCFTSAEDRTSTWPHAGPLCYLNLVFSPVVLLIVLLASLFSAPILALFTLPMFTMAYPRTASFWPMAWSSLKGKDSDSELSGGSDADQAYYAQFAPALLTSLNRAGCGGSDVGINETLSSVTPSYLLARHEDKIVWVEIVERGHRFIRYDVKGLELQETSCHNTEATELDSLLDAAFDAGETCLPNKAGLLHVATPLAKLPVMTYSDTRNVLTGVIEAPETLTLIAETFAKTLLWYLIFFLADNRGSDVGKKAATTAATNGNVESGRKNNVSADDYVVSIKKEEGKNGAPEHPHQGNGFAGDDELTSRQWASKPNLRRPSEANERRASMLSNSSNSSNNSVFDSSSLDIDVDEVMNAIDGGPPLPSRKDTSARLERRNLLPPIKKKMDAELPAERHVEDTGIVTHPITAGPGAKLHRSAFLSDDEEEDGGGGRDGGEKAFSSALAKKLLSPEISMSLPSVSPYDAISKEWRGLLLSDTWMETVSKAVLTSSRFSVADVGELVRDAAFKTALTGIIAQGFSSMYDLRPEDFGLSDASSHLQKVCSRLGPSAVARTFEGGQPTPFSPFDNTNPRFQRSVVLPAYRSAVKLALDQVLLGPYSSPDEELSEALSDLDENWFLGVETESGWREAVIDEVPNLFSVSVDKAEETGAATDTYRSHLLVFRESQVSLARLNPEVVRSLWASLNFELLYLTNDDDERYSIQADERLLRNITVQAAEPPLGYPVYSRSFVMSAE